MRIALDTNVIVSHLKDDEFAEDTRSFLKWAKETKQSLLISEIAYAELYAGIKLSADPILEERRVQRFLAVNHIEVRLHGSLDVAKRSGRIYANYLAEVGVARGRILPDFLVGAHAEIYGEALATWNPKDFVKYLKVPVLTPTQIIQRYSFKSEET
ncbi:MAG: tRNA(fMet)-specific endonuclease VapC [Candidatus Bathyarchaeota archaeon BA2]|nr:MAG: tRNA(fMet)-specific endonuclease VapC [Candidatus Bathyarchaeota archaeon BA2]